MILECPECRSRYLVPDSAIGAAGRMVRCASCRHSWHQAGVAAEPAPAPLPPPARADAEPAPPLPFAAEDASDPTRNDDFAPTDDFVSPPAGDYDVSEEPAYRPRRNPARRWTIAAIAAAVLLLAGIGIIMWSTAPGLLQRIGLPLGQAESPLRLVDNPIERRDLTNGSELFAVSGKVLNPSATAQRVPDIRADLRDASGRIVFSWTITPEQRTLAPKSAIDFNSAKLDVPATSKRLELSFVGESGG